MIDTATTPAPARAPAIDAGELELVHQARGGSLMAFETLYRTHQARLRTLCLRMVRDRDAADELAQEAFVTAWRKLDGFRGESSFSTWLVRIALNTSVSRRRSEGRRTRHELAAVAEQPERTRPDRGTELGVDLDRAIRALPKRARAIFVLHDVEGYRHREIAAMMDVTVGTSKAQLHRARKLLREALKR